MLSWLPAWQWEQYESMLSWLPAWQWAPTPSEPLLHPSVERTEVAAGSLYDVVQAMSFAVSQSPMPSTELNEQPLKNCVLPRHTKRVPALLDTPDWDWRHRMTASLYLEVVDVLGVMSV